MSALARASLLRVLALLCAAFLVVPAPAFAANDNPANPVSLTAANPSVSDNLVGNTGGAYRYYQVAYQGANAPVLFTLTYQPAYGSGNGAFGFNLYAPSGLTFAGQVTNLNGSIGTAQYTLTNGAAMDVLVQVYNYTAGGPVSYTLAVTGLSGGSTSTIVAHNNTTPGQATNVPTINANLGGKIVGNAAGAYNYYTLHYPGGNTQLAIGMNATPSSNGSTQQYGFNVYRTLPNGTTSIVAQGGIIASDVNSSTIGATITDAAAGDYQLQVYNYWPNVTVSYGIHLTGQAGPATPASGNRDAGHAIVLNSARMGATETLAGSHSGNFDYYLVNWPGNASPLTISVTYGALNGVPLNALGFQVYDGSTLLATANPVDDGNGVMAAVWSYPYWSNTNTNPRPFLIQVFNYQDGTSVPYTIYQVGSK